MAFRKHPISRLAILGFTLCTVLGLPLSLKADSAALRAYGSQSLIFEENLGQSRASVQYLSRNKGFLLFLRNNDALLSFAEPETEAAGPLHLGKLLALNEEPKLKGKTARRWLQLTWVDGNINASLQGVEELPSKSHYFIGNQARAWLSDLSNYRAVTASGIYPDMKLKYYDAAGSLEFDWQLEPGADVSKIRLGIAGNDLLDLDAQGDLEILFAKGLVLKIRAPQAYQWVQGQKQILKSSFQIFTEHEVGFQLGPFDPRIALTIDPALAYSSYLGGSGTDEAAAVATDNLGNAYFTGAASSSNFPTENPLQSTENSSSSNAVVSVLNPAGALVYSSYLGGSGANGDIGTGIAVDAAQNIYLVGDTSSSDFPLQGAFESSCLACPSSRADGFVSKLNAGGASLAYSSYLGGSGGDGASHVALDSNNCAYVVGYTTSSDFPLVHPFQASFGGNQDAFVSKLDAAGNTLLYSSYLGGSQSGLGYGVAVDGSGNAYVAGATNCTDFPLVHPFQSLCVPCSTGAPNCFVTKVDASGTTLDYSSYLGGSVGDEAFAIALDPSNNAYVVGTTSSTDFNLLNPFQASCAACISSRGAFLSKVDASGTTLDYSTFLAGSTSDELLGVGVDALGEAYVAGQSWSSDYPSVNPIQTNCSSCPSNSDGMLSEMNSSGNALLFSSFLGGSGADLINGIVVDSNGNAFLSGVTNSPDFPTINAFESSLAGSSNGFVAKISKVMPSPTSTISPSFTVSPTLTVSPTVTETSTLQPTSTAGPLNGPFKIDLALPDLDPSPGGPRGIHVHIPSGADSLSLKIYTKGMMCIGSYSAQGDPNNAWQVFALSPEVFSISENGLYYYVVTATKNGANSAPYIGKFFILR